MTAVRRNIVGIAAVVVVACLGNYVGAGGDFLTLDTDRNGLLTDHEVDVHGRSLFARLDADHSNGLNVAELNGRLGDPVLRAADVNRDGELTWEEFDGLLRARFKSANTNGDGAVDERELEALAGALLLVMLRP
jgi:hypothetical protein